MGKTLHLRTDWDEAASRNFYETLRKMPEAVRGEAVLMQAESLVKNAENEVDARLDGAESLLNYWTLHYFDEKQNEKVQTLLKEIYIKMGKKEKAENLSK